MPKALIIIDVQKGFINNLTAGVIKKIRKYIIKSRNKYDLIIFTKYFNHKNSSFVKFHNWYGFMDESDTDLVDEIKEFSNAKNTFIKDTFSSFVNNKLYNILKKNNIEKVELCGFDTENCVLTFARDAFDRGMSVVVLKELCASHLDKRMHKNALDIIENNIGKIK